MRSLKDVEERQRQGKLKIFLGAAAGVGKTFAMLSEAQEQRERGADVVIGVIETHGRKETEALTEGLEQLPLREFEYKGTRLKEFDLDGALARRPSLILVDELAHSNAHGSRHSKRWQDIDELLKAGIDVFTALNIQHLESLKDVVAQVTGVLVRETVPDSIVERADEIEVIDVPPEELITRLKEGKVYVPERIEHALEGFFRKGNLIALRELALRRAADTVDAQMQSYRAEKGVRGLWPTRDRILVCVAPNKLASKVVRSAARIGAASHAELLAVSVESDRQSNRSPEEIDHGREALRLAESLGMHTVILCGNDIVAEVLRYAQQRNVNLIVVGKPVKPRWREVLFGSVVDELVRQSGDIDVHVITMLADREASKPFVMRARPEARSAKGYAASLGVVGLATAICFAMYASLDLSNLIMVYLGGVAFVASRFGPRETIFSAGLSVLLFDVLFVPPRFTLAVSDSQYIITFAVMLGIAMLISSLTLRVRRQAQDSAERERRTAALYTLSKEMARARSKREIASAAAKEIRDVFDADAAVLLLENDLTPIASSTSGFEREPSESAVAAWCLKHSEAAGRGTETLPGARGLYLPLRGGQRALGVLAILPSEANWPLAAAQKNLLETFANGLGLAIERTILAKEFHEARIQAESERIRNALLSSISHDLRTPLTAIAGAASSLKEGQGDASELAETIYEESVRLNLQVQNLLDMTRLQSGEVQPKLDWHSAEELIGSALERSRELLHGRKVNVSLAPDLPLLRVDGELMQKVFVNLLENVATHTPEGTPVDIWADVMREVLRLNVADRGSGIAKGDEAKIFERFFRREERKLPGGFGLGLAICRAIMRLHDGRIWAENRSDGPGAVFHVEILKPDKQPEVPSG